MPGLPADAGERWEAALCHRVHSWFLLLNNIPLSGHAIALVYEVLLGTEAVCRGACWLPLSCGNWPRTARYLQPVT